MKLQNKEVYQEYMRGVKKDEIPDLMGRNKEEILFKLELNAWGASLDKGEAPYWMIKAYKIISEMEIEPLDKPLAYNLRIPTDRINLLVEEPFKNVTNGKSYWDFKTHSETPIFEGNTTGQIKIE